jgi:hypothetical protein
VGHAQAGGDVNALLAALMVVGLVLQMLVVLSTRSLRRRLDAAQRERDKLAEHIVDALPPPGEQR